MHKVRAALGQREHPPRETPRAGGSVTVAGAVMPPAVVILGVVEAVELVRVVIETVRRLLGFVVIVAVVARRRLLLRALADDMKLLAGQLGDLLKRLFEIHPLIFSRETIHR